MRRTLIAVGLLLGFGSFGAWAREPVSLARTHIVASANPMASDAGLEALRAGGSALDAAIAMQMVLGVVEPQASGIGGGGFLVHYRAASRAVTVWDGRETAPAAAGERLLLDENGRPLSFPQAVVSGLSVGVPGVVRLLEDTHKRFGRLPWAKLFEPAIKLAEGGFPAPPRLAAALASETVLKHDPQALGVYFDAGGSPVARGATVRNPRLAATMRAIAEK
jgi:gamma-glutamyltranspeptidase/glutathione hydrolase